MATFIDRLPSDLRGETVRFNVEEDTEATDYQDGTIEDEGGDDRNSWSGGGSGTQLLWVERPQRAGRRGRPVFQSSAGGSLGNVWSNALDGVLRVSLGGAEAHPSFFTPSSHPGR